MNTRDSTSSAPLEISLAGSGITNYATRSGASVTLEPSPPRGQAPEAWRHQLDGVAGGVAEVQRVSATFPGFLVFDGHPMDPQLLPPCIEILGGDAHREMTRALALRERASGRPEGSPRTGTPAAWSGPQPGRTRAARLLSPEASDRERRDRTARPVPGRRRKSPFPQGTRSVSCAAHLESGGDRPRDVHQSRPGFVRRRVPRDRQPGGPPPNMYPKPEQTQGAGLPSAGFGGNVKWVCVGSKAMRMHSGDDWT